MQTCPEEASRIARTSPDPWTLKIARATVLLETRLDRPIPMEDIAAACGLSHSWFSKRFRATFGISPRQWRLRSRLQCASMLLRDSRMSLAEIAETCGFSDQSHLTRVFTREMGAPPGAWRTENARITR
jgi:AraC family transcriptional regulator